MKLLNLFTNDIVKILASTKQSVCWYDQILNHNSNMFGISGFKFKGYLRTQYSTIFRLYEYETWYAENF
ncbi:MAG: hypothetical protein KDH96_09210 [Candidatus Riesia sp.]|nr:hypothetical protein [Candidatus Riesia sp.]